MTIDVQEIQAHFADLLERVIAGEEIVIARDGQPIARLLPPNGNGADMQKKRRTPGLDSGHARIADDFDAPLPQDIQCFFE